MVFASTGAAGRIGDVHIDAIVGLSGPKEWARTTTALEDGAPVGLHRRRNAQTLSVEILISDAPPTALADVVGAWEFQHAQRTKERLEQLANDGTEVSFFDGLNFWRPPSGRRSWIIDKIDERVAVEEQGITVRTYRATITLGEVPRFSSLFTAIDTQASESVADSVDGVVDSGQQSTTTVPDEAAAGVVLS
jgi:hypothetical protein